MERQAMNISIKELRDKANQLENELSRTPIKDVLNHKCLVNIINKHNMSDEWKFEN